MTIGNQEHYKDIDDVLRHASPDLRVLKPGVWEFTLVNGKPFQVNAQVVNDWLIFETHHSGVTKNYWWLLQANRRLGANCRFLVTARTIRLRCEVNLSERINLPSRVQRVTSDFEAGINLLHKGPSMHSSLTPTQEERNLKSLLELCAASGWEGSLREGIGIAVPLEVEHKVCQAIVKLDHQDRLLITGEIPTAGKKAAAPWQEAVSSFLLSVTTRLKMVRAEAITNDAGDPEDDNVRFALLLAPDANTVELHEAFANLSMAMELAIDEVAGLSDPRVATRYWNMHYVCD